MSLNTIKRRIGLGIGALYVLLAEYAMGIVAVLIFSMIAYVMVRTYAADPITTFAIVAAVLVAFAVIGSMLYGLGVLAERKTATRKEDGRE